MRGRDVVSGGGRPGNGDGLRFRIALRSLGRCRWFGRRRRSRRDACLPGPTRGNPPGPRDGTRRRLPGTRRSSVDRLGRSLRSVLGVLPGGTRRCLSLPRTFCFRRRVRRRRCCGTGGLGGLGGDGRRRGHRRLRAWSLAFGRGGGARVDRLFGGRSRDRFGRRPARRRRRLRSRCLVSGRGGNARTGRLLGRRGGDRFGRRLARRRDMRVLRCCVRCARLSSDVGRTRLGDGSCRCVVGCGRHRGGLLPGRNRRLRCFRLLPRGLGRARVADDRPDPRARACAGRTLPRAGAGICGARRAGLGGCRLRRRLGCGLRPGVAFGRRGGLRRGLRSGRRRRRGFGASRSRRVRRGFLRGLRPCRTRPEARARGPTRRGLGVGERGRAHATRLRRRRGSLNGRGLVDGVAGNVSRLDRPGRGRGDTRHVGGRGLGGRGRCRRLGGRRGFRPRRARRLGLVHRLGRLLRRLLLRLRCGCVLGKRHRARGLRYLLLRGRFLCLGRRGFLRSLLLVLLGRQRRGRRHRLGTGVRRSVRLGSVRLWSGARGGVRLLGVLLCGVGLGGVRLSVGLYRPRTAGLSRNHRRLPRCGRRTLGRLRGVRLQRVRLRGVRLRRVRTIGLSRNNRRLPCRRRRILSGSDRLVLCRYGPAAHSALSARRQGRTRRRSATGSGGHRLDLLRLRRSRWLLRELHRYGGGLGLCARRGRRVRELLRRRCGGRGVIRGLPRRRALRCGVLLLLRQCFRAGPYPGARRRRHVLTGVDGLVSEGRCRAGVGRVASRHPERPGLRRLFGDLRGGRPGVRELVRAGVLGVWHLRLGLLRGCELLGGHAELWSGSGRCEACGRDGRGCGGRHAVGERAHRSRRGSGALLEWSRRHRCPRGRRVGRRLGHPVRRRGSAVLRNTELPGVDRRNGRRRHGRRVRDRSVAHLVCTRRRGVGVCAECGRADLSVRVARDGRGCRSRRGGLGVAWLRHAVRACHRREMPLSRRHGMARHGGRERLSVLCVLHVRHLRHLRHGRLRGRHVLPLRGHVAERVGGRAHRVAGSRNTGRDRSRRHVGGLEVAGLRRRHLGPAALRAGHEQRVVVVQVVEFVDAVGVGVAVCGTGRAGVPRDGRRVLRPACGTQLV